MTRYCLNGTTGRCLCDSCFAARYVARWRAILSTLALRSYTRPTVAPADVAATLAPMLHTLAVRARLREHSELDVEYLKWEEPFRMKPDSSLVVGLVDAVDPLLWRQLDVGHG